MTPEEQALNSLSGTGNAPRKSSSVDMWRTLIGRPLEDWIPGTLPKTQQVPLTQTHESLTGPADASEGSTILGRYLFGKGQPSIEVDVGRATAKKGPNEAGQVAAHEAGHSIWMQDISPEQQKGWIELHRQHLRNSVATKAAWPDFMTNYGNDPSHSFAAAYGYYVRDPELLKKQSPSAYNFIRDLTGFEYARPRR